jgi:hypothetical protein
MTVKEWSAFFFATSQPATLALSWDTRQRKVSQAHKFSAFSLQPNQP